MFRAQRENSFLSPVLRSHSKLCVCVCRFSRRRRRDRCRHRRRRRCFRERSEEVVGFDGVRDPLKGGRDEG